VDTEPPRFLEFERWWGGFFLMNREEIEWITKNLFVGNNLWSGTVQSREGRPFDLRDITSPIVLFASLGDNITPPQQAFNWVADIYQSTDEIKARGQVIVGLLHQDVGHLGIFVSGRVAKKEHSQIVSVLKSIEALPPGLYGMQITERKSSNGKVEYEVQFVEKRLEEVQERLNRFKRADEKPFESVEKIADFNQRSYELFARPFVQGISNEATAQTLRTFHPLRMQHWLSSDLNPWLAWLGPMAAAVKDHRQSLAPDAPAHRIESMISEVVSASLDFYREMRDAQSEAMFYQVYGNLFSLYGAGGGSAEVAERVEPSEGRSQFAQDAVALMGTGGYAEAVARVFALLARHDVPFPLFQLHLKRELVAKYADLLPKTSLHQQRRIRGQQDLIVREDREGALRTLPQLLTNPADRKRLRELLMRVKNDKAVGQLKLIPEQLSMLRQIEAALGEPRRNRAVRRTSTRTNSRRGMQPA